MRYALTTSIFKATFLVLKNLLYNHVTFVSVIGQYYVSILFLLLILFSMLLRYISRLVAGQIKYHCHRNSTCGFVLYLYACAVKILMLHDSVQLITDKYFIYIKNRRDALLVVEMGSSWLNIAIFNVCETRCIVSVSSYTERKSLVQNL